LEYSLEVNISTTGVVGIFTGGKYLIVLITFWGSKNVII
jgi:hypothetical protein